MPPDANGTALVPPITVPLVVYYAIWPEVPELIVPLAPPPPDPVPQGEPVFVIYPESSTCRQKSPEEAASPGNLIAFGARNAASRFVLDPE